MNYYFKTGLIVLVLFMAGCSVEQPAGRVVANSNVETVKTWISASQVKADSMAVVEAHMAADGLVYRPRYVGFGFTHDGFNSGRMIVETITPGSPADGVLEIGDEFISVRDVAVSPDTMDRLDFRGKAGEAVDAKIIRNGEELAISVVRGTVTATITKADMLEWMQTQDEDEWGDEQHTLHEVIGDGDIVYAWTQTVNTDEISGASIDVHTVSRFGFNESGQIIAIANLSESRFALEQMGYAITR